MQVLIGVCLLAIAGCVSGAVINYSFTISYGDAAPDNFLQHDAILINGAFPGPTIRANPFDTIVVRVTNQLNHSLAVHWHGLMQRTSKDADGVANVTQQPIEPGSFYIYVINLDGQHGTYAYHAHTRLDNIWCHGVIIIDDRDILKGNPVYDYYEDRVVLFSQLWHVPVDVLFTQIPALPPANSILINGKSYGVWNTFADALRRDVDKGYDVITVKPNRVYRFRFISLNDDSAANCTISGHGLTIIEVDGYITNPIPVDHLQINILQRYNVLVKTDQAIANYIIQCILMPNGGADNGVAILHYEGAPDPTPLRTVQRNGTAAASPLTPWVLDQLRPSTILPVNQRLVYPIPTYYDVEILIEHEFANGRFTVNNETFVYPPINYLQQFQTGVDISQDPSVYTVDVGQVVQVVFQNKDIVPNFSLQHPWHMHGHTFYVVGFGPDRFDPIADNALISDNIANGRVEFRDVITLFANSTRVNGSELEPGYSGWTAIRFLANNPGVWLTHCHITPHLLIGKVYLLHTRDFQCKAAGYFAQPFDCTTFNQCVPVGNSFRRFQQTCPVGLYFDPRITACNYPFLVPRCTGQIYDSITNYAELFAFYAANNLG